MKDLPDVEPAVRTVRVRPGGRWTTYADVLAALRTRWERGELLTGGAGSAPLWSPIVVPLRSPTSAEISDDYDGAQSWVNDWRTRGGRLRIERVAVGGRLIGVNEVPRRIWIDTPAALWSVLGVPSQAARFHEIAAAASPELAAWVAANPMKVMTHEAVWSKLTAICGWFRADAVPGTHLRQIDVPGVDTKFIETHRGLLAELLDACLPADRVDAQYPRSDFVHRYRLASKPAYLRLRRLDGGAVYPQLPGVQELSLRAGELAGVPVPCRTVFVIENEVSYLAFPPVPDAMAVFGSGYAVSLLAAADWLGERDVAYWSDIDTHGFMMLNRLRAAFGNTRSILMDRDTLLDHEVHWGTEPSQVNAALPHLTSSERRVYEDLLEATFAPSLRLEQERVSYRALLAAVTRPPAS